MTLQRLIRITSIALIAVVAFGGIADAKHKKRKHQKPKPAAAARVWYGSAATLVLRTGVLPGVTPANFAPDTQLDGPTLQALVGVAFPKTAKRVRVIEPGQPVTMGDVDAAFVIAAGLNDTAIRAEQLIEAAGYDARPGVGYEIVARLLRLRTNLEQADDLKEHAWYEQASQADAVWSAGQALQWGGWESQVAIDTVELLAQVPPTTRLQHDAIQRAFDFIGMPYIWGGTSERPQVLFGAPTAGGFDCSGFLWRVLALDATSPKGVLAAFGGRTTFEMARTAKPAQRLSREAIIPADIMLFGPGGLQASSGSIGHSGMAISPQLFIQSSGQGIALARWDTGYYKDRLAFGKRVLLP